MIDNSQLQKILPQAYPFLLLDRVEDVRPGHSLLAVKNITANEWPFSQERRQNAHYPETLLIEAAAQAALVLYALSKTIFKIRYFILSSIKAEFYENINLGQCLYIKTLASKMLDNMGYMDMTLSKDFDPKIADIQIFYKVYFQSNEEK